MKKKVEERAEVAARLLDSAELAETDLDSAWEATIERRAAELDSGAVEGVSWEQLQQRLLSGGRSS